MKDGSRLAPSLTPFNRTSASETPAEPRPPLSGCRIRTWRGWTSDRKSAAVGSVNERLSGGDRVSLPTELEFKH
jgi:hypothetical protein